MVVWWRRWRVDGSGQWRALKDMGGNLHFQELTEDDGVVY
jgi:hypothetical protein